MPLNRSTTILLAEDDPRDVELLRASTRDVPVQIDVVTDGLAALNYLFLRKNPALILLDLKLPLLDGFDVLRRIKDSGATRHIPVVVLTGSTLADDMKNSYAAGANAFVIKPMGIPALRQSMTSVINFWMRQNSVPSLAQVVRLS